MELTSEMFYVETVFHCDTEEKANELLHKLHQLGYKWSDNELLTDFNNYNKYNRGSCYKIYNNKYITSQYYEYYHKRGNKIIEYVLDKDDEDKFINEGEFHKKEIDELETLDFAVNKITKELYYCDDDGSPCYKCLFNSALEDCKKLRDIWYFSQHREEKICTLKEKEKEYLKGIIKPFKDNVIYVEKCLSDCSYSPKYEFIGIVVTGNPWHMIALPPFEEKTMYEGMELNEKYTIERLGLSFDKALDETSYIDNMKLLGI